MLGHHQPRASAVPAGQAGRLAERGWPHRAEPYLLADDVEDQIWRRWDFALALLCSSMVTFGRSSSMATPCATCTTGSLVYREHQGDTRLLRSGPFFTSSPSSEAHDGKHDLNSCVVCSCRTRVETAPQTNRRALILIGWIADFATSLLANKKPAHEV